MKKSDLRFALGIPGEATLTKLEIQDIDRVMRRWNRYMNNKLELLTLFDGIPHILSILKNSNTTIGIVSSKSREALDEILSSLGINGFFQNIICQEDTEYHKPRPEPILKFIERYNINALSAIYVGDTVYDMQSANSAGIDFGLALWGAKDKNIEAKFSFEEPNQIIELILKKGIPFC